MTEKTFNVAGHELRPLQGRGRGRAERAPRGGEGQRRRR